LGGGNHFIEIQKGKPKGTKYSFLILDSRNSYDVVGKMLGSQNKSANTVATINALEALVTPEDIKNIRRN